MLCLFILPAASSVFLKPDRGDIVIAVSCIYDSVYILMFRFFISIICKGYNPGPLDGALGPKSFAKMSALFKGSPEF